MLRITNCKDVYAVMVAGILCLAYVVDKQLIFTGRFFNGFVADQILIKYLFLLILHVTTTGFIRRKKTRLCYGFRLAPSGHTSLFS